MFSNQLVDRRFLNRISFSHKEKASIPIGRKPASWPGSIWESSPSYENLTCYTPHKIFLLYLPFNDIYYFNTGVHCWEYFLSNCSDNPDLWNFNFLRDFVPWVAIYFFKVEDKLVKLSSPFLHTCCNAKTC